MSANCSFANSDHSGTLEPPPPNVENWLSNSPFRISGVTEPEFRYSREFSTIPVRTGLPRQALELSGRIPLGLATLIVSLPFLTTEIADRPYSAEGSHADIGSA